MALTAWVVAVILQQAAASTTPAAISGQLQMIDGSLATAVRVAAIPAPPPSIRPTDGQNYYASQTAVAVALSDATGRYRLNNVPAGRYFIVAGPVGNATFYPSTTDIDAAAVVTVGGGPALDDLSFKLLRSPGSRVRGRVMPPPPAGSQERAIVSGVTLGELIETPVREDGTFEFGRVPGGSYLLSLFPTPPGMASRPFQVANEDVISLDLTRPPVRTVSGRIAVDRGPLPRALLGFSTPQGYVSGSINPDGTFTARLHIARHQVEMGGLPVGYSLASVRVGPREALGDGVVVGDADISGIVITVAAPRQLPRLTGRIVDHDRNRPAPRVVITGPIVGSVEAAVQPDGSFEFAMLPPGLYRVRVPQMPEISEVQVVVDLAGADVRLLPRR